MKEKKNTSSQMRAANVTKARNGRKGNTSCAECPVCPTMTRANFNWAGMNKSHSHQPSLSEVTF